MLIKSIFFILILGISFFANTQARFELGYSFGANATTSKTIKSDNMTWGYYTPPLPSTWSNHWYLGWGNKKDKIYVVFDGGGLGPTFQVKSYANKYPFDDNVSPDGSTNMSVKTSIQGRARSNSNLLKLSLLYKHTLYFSKNFYHKSVFGVGYLKTRQASGGANFGSGQYIDSLGWVEHGFIQDKYEYFRLQNLYLTFGYQLTYKIGNRWNWNAQIMYNQGLYKMIRWHTYRTYSESLTGYTEFDEQWSFTRLSYFAFLTGVSYELPNKKERNARKHLD
jgi:hypothetical protein